MNKIIIICLLSLSITSQAQFLNKPAPTEFEVALNNSKDVSSLLKLAAIARSTSNFKNLQRILEKIVKHKPHLNLFKYKLAEAYALNSDKTKAFNALIGLQKQGLYFDISNNPKFSNINTYPVFDYIKENFDANGKHFGEGKESFYIDESFSGLLFENIAFDANSKSFLMGSLRDGRIIKIAEDGEISTLVPPSVGGKNGPWSVVDLSVDAKSNTLWVASSAISQFGKLTKETVGMAGIFKYNLKTGKLIKSYFLPENKRPSVISSMHVTPQGEVYLISSLKNIVLKLIKDTGQFSVVFSTTKYTNLRNITGDETGKLLYLSDSEEGIIIVSLENNQVYTLNNSDTLNLTGISDLIYDDNGLIIFQNAFKPERVIRLQLGKKKLGFANLFPIESAHPKFNSLSFGVVVGEGLYYISNSQLPKTNLYGGLLEGQTWENMYILSSAKHYNEKETIEYNKKIDEYKKKAGVKKEL